MGLWPGIFDQSTVLWGKKFTTQIRPCKRLYKQYTRKRERFMFIAALFTIAKSWEQPVSLSGGMDKQNVVFSYSVISFSHKKKY